MRRFLNSIFILVLAGSLAAAQTTTPKAAAGKPAEKSTQKTAATDAVANLPSEATVSVDVAD